MTTPFAWIDPPPRPAPHRVIRAVGRRRDRGRGVAHAGGFDAACREVPVRPVQYSVGW